MNSIFKQIILNKNIQRTEGAERIIKFINMFAFKNSIQNTKTLWRKNNNEFNFIFILELKDDSQMYIISQQVHYQE